MPSVALETRIEARTQQIGREMFDRIRADRRSIFSSEWWEERLLAQCMRNERLKVQAFRFIDVLPTMNDERDIARHLKEYFADADLLNGNGKRNGRSAHHGNGHDRGEEVHAALAELDPPEGRRFTRFLARAMNFDRLDSPAARLAAWAARKGSVKMAHRFIAGTTVREAERAIRGMRARKMAFTIDVLGEAALSDAESRHYQKIYENLIVELSRRSREWPRVEQIDLAAGVALPRVNVSVKLSSLFSQFDAIDPEGTKRVVKERLRPLLRAGMSHGAHIHIDMEHYAVKTLTLEICREIFMEDEFRDYPHFGVVLQAYLRDCERDARELLDWARLRGVPIWVRLVKGAYWDTETVLAQQQHWPCPVWERKWQSDANFERISRLLIENHRHIRTAVASHNVRSLAYGMALREAFDVPGTAFELQMLYGMGDPIKRAGVEMGQRCRIYTPYGELLPGMAYLIRRLLENTANESFLRHSNAEDASVDELLEDPRRHEGTQARRHEGEGSGIRGEGDFIGGAQLRDSDASCLRASVPSCLPRYEFEEPLMYDFENVPNTDFTLEENRGKMRAALDDVRARLNAEYPLVVGGERITTGQWKDSNNPSRPAEIIGKVAQADEAAARKAVDVAAEAFRDWRWVEPEERAEYLFRVAEIMQRRRFELAAIEVLECGKPWREADADVSEAIDFCNYYAHEMIRMAENIRRRDIPGETNEYYYAPRGVVAVISPWNFPLAILTGMATAAVVTGNTVIMKPAAPQMVIAYELMVMFEEAGLPPGVLNYLPGPGSMVGEVLVKHPKVAMIAFTGSREVGCRINRVAAETTTSQPALKKVIAEMGGKNAAIVDSDADLDEAVKGVLYSAFGYAGQKCSACSRCIVLDGAYEQFVPRLIEAARSIQVGPADDPGTFVPPVIDANAAKSIREYIEVGKREAECALETDVSGLIEQTAGGYFIGPTIFTDVAPDARIAREEIFGPVLAVIRAPDIETAIDIFNNTDYALTGGIFSRSPANIEKARRECECGNFYINRKISGALVDLQPFGGFKMSGLGSKAGGPDYLIQFCEPRSVTENTLRRGFAPSDDVVEMLG